MYAGYCQRLIAIQNWLAGRKLALHTVAASVIIDDLSRLHQWLSCALYLRAWSPPEGVEALTDLPWRHREVL